MWASAFNMRQLTVFVLLLLLTGCSMEKRRYQKGISFNWFHTTAAPKSADRNNSFLVYSNAGSENTVKRLAVGIPVPETPLPRVYEASRVAKRATKREHTSIDRDTCDLLVMKNGEEIPVRVLE